MNKQKKKLSATFDVELLKNISFIEWHIYQYNTGTSINQSNYTGCLKSPGRKFNCHEKIFK